MNSALAGLAWWPRLKATRLGRWLFARILFHHVPYSGSLNAEILHLEPGHARVRLRDRRAVRNHLNSIHAVALANLGELTSGMALMAQMPVQARGIVTRLTIEYRKKARGNLDAECRCNIPVIDHALDYEVCAVISDQSGDIVAVTRVEWRLAPKDAP